jgi:uncharacterized membrane protein
MGNIIKYQQYKNGVFGMRAIIIDLIFYIFILGGGYISGYPKVGVGVIGVLVLGDLILSYFCGKRLGG